MKRRDAIKNTAAFIGGLSLISAGSLIQSCKPDLTETWEGQFLTAKQSRLLEEVAETIIPQTETPGAKEAKVVRYLDEYYARFLDQEDQEKTIQAIEKFDKIAQDKFSQDFISCSTEQRHEVFQFMLDARGDENGNLNENFKHIRSQVSSAFFGSELGATKVLAYDPIPGEYNGCIPLTENMKGWS